MTYKQAFDKITEAYIKGEIIPMESKFCFCGTLCDNKNDWKMSHKYEYSWVEFDKMEYALLYTINCLGSDNKNPSEEALFKGMCAALDILKQVHVDRGETIDEEVTFQKRELCKS